MKLLPLGRRVRHRRGRGGAIASGALLLTVLASLVGQTGPAYAAAPSPAATSTPQPAGAAADPSTGAASAAPADSSPKTNAVPKLDPKAEHEAVARALQQADPTGPCPAGLDPQTVVSCSIDPNQTVSFSVTLKQKDLVLVQVSSTANFIYPSLVAPDGTAVTCDRPGNSSSGWLRCPTSQAGIHTLKVRSNESLQTAIAVSYVPLLSTTGCKSVNAADRTLAAPTVFHGSLPLGMATDCYDLNMAAGEVLRSHSSSFRVIQTVYDATGANLCNTQYDQRTSFDCTLTGTAPFRLTVQAVFGGAETYDYSAARLSTPEGCVTVAPQAYGDSPDLTATARCRTLRVPAASHYSFNSVSAATAPSGGLFKTDGTALTAGGCAIGSCDLAAGDYIWAVNPEVADAGAFGMAFHAATETRGCTATADDGLVSGAAKGTFGGPGQQLCLTLPTAAGKGLYLLNRPPADGTSVAVEVDDANGAKQCDNGGSSYAVCKLTGTAPFRAVLSGTPAKSYQLVINRTGDPAGCAAWPQSTFGGAWGAEIALTADVQQACLSLPADQHSTSEMYDYTNTKNQAYASIQFADASGNAPDCTGIGGSSTGSCKFTAGVPYTAMLVGAGWQATDTYKLVRRDLSPTATCPTPASTTVGGPSMPFDLTSALDSRCIRVTGAATDRFWFSTRTLGSRYDPSTLLMVVDANGAFVCTQWGIACRVTGSTSYVVIVLASGYNGSTIHTNVDTWKVGTASGWAPECAGNKISVDGFPLRNGVLTESSTAYCAVVDMVPNQAFDVVGTASATGVANPYLTVVGNSDWVDSNLTYQCDSSYGTFGARCQATSNAVAGQAVLVLSAAQVATPVEYSMQGLCDSGCTRQAGPQLSGVTPATGAAGTLTQAVVHGSGLTLGTKVKLVRSDSGDSNQPVMKPVSVSADGTALNVLVDTNALTAGLYDVVLDGIGYTQGTPSPGYLPKAYTVTAAAGPAKSRFVPITPSRFLDTREGVGAPKAPVGPGGVLSLQVAGVKGIPATGVTAVVMNVTAVNPTSAGFVTVYPDGQAVPGVSNLNFTAGQVVPNLVTVPVVNGKVDLRNFQGSVDLVADVTGYYTDGSTGSALTSITPSRFLDTREGVGAPKAPVGPGGVLSLQVAGVKGIPATGVTAVVMNVTAVNPTSAGFVTVYPDGQAVPGVSNLNFTAGQVVPNLVVVPVVNGKVDLRNFQGSVDLVADVTGYYSATGSTYSAAGPVRLLDTREGIGARAGAVGQGGLVSIQLSGVAGVPATGVTAVVLNVTVTEPTDSSYLTVYPHGIDRPGVSNLNYTAGQTVANLVVVPVVDGRVTFANFWGDAHVIADLNGYFAS